MKHRFSVSTLVFAVVFAFVSALCAQVGNNNPGGVSGIFNGQITTGCSYDPYTGNAKRAITDIAVAGAVGDYPLALVRTANSRNPIGGYPFDWAGNWNHNYNWRLEDSPTVNSPNLQPARFTVDFPDGRVETFQAVTWDNGCYPLNGCYRVRPGPDTPAQSTSAGMRERFQPLNYGYCYLILPDGGKVKFYATQHQLPHQQWYYTYQALAIIDPHGLQTNLTYDGGGRLSQVTEPAGRYLQFTYDPTYGNRISLVTASDGRSVSYIYGNQPSISWPVLQQVVYNYNDNVNRTASYQYCTSNLGDNNTSPLLRACDDPMYAGPMKRIAYEYKPGGPSDPNNPDGTRPVYGQILNERYWDGVNADVLTGAIVSTLTVGASPSNHNIRTENAPINRTRTFLYTAQGYVTSCTDFMSNSASQGYDAYNYINYVVDRNGHRTDFTNEPIVGNVTQVQFPLTTGDTPGQTQRPTIQYTYGWSGCADANNRDANNPYWVCSATDEGGHVTQFTLDTNHRVTRIDYPHPDGGYETFSYDSAHFYQVNSHRLQTGGTETFAYDSSHRLYFYSDPYHSNPSNFSLQYSYDGLDRVNGVLDTLWHPTNFDHNGRGQVTVTTLPPDPSDNQRHTITNAYNPDGTLQSRTDELNHVTSYTYDDYRRLKSVTLPDRGDGTGTHGTSFYYDVNGTGDDYRYTDSRVTYITLASGKTTHTDYDANRRKWHVTVGYGTPDGATTMYTPDNVGNVTLITNPRTNSIATVYDERNRPSELHDAYGKITYFKYDTAGHKYQIIRPNNATITYNSYDAMNRLLQQTVTQAPNPDAVSKFTYYTPSDPGSPPVGLLHTMQDPRLVAINSADAYTYSYDSMGRKTQLQYPHDSFNVQRTEQWSYNDPVGRLYQFTNRNGNIQTFSYDALNRMTGFTWNDNGTTPSVSFGYDPASRLTSVNNANANISRAYWNDNLLHSETELATGGVAQTVSYFYNADGIRAGDSHHPGLQIPGYWFTYTYNNRNQLSQINSGFNTVATYTYDENHCNGSNCTGDLTSRSLGNTTSTSYSYDALDRVTAITHSLNGTTRRFNYGYDINSGNRLWTERDGGNGDVFGYDLADQTNGVLLNVSHPDTTPTATPAPNISYDANGNRTAYLGDNYTINNLSQYTSRTIGNTTITPAYDNNGNLTYGLDQPSQSTYSYDAQNRLLSATKGISSITFAYDGLNRQVNRTVTNAGPSTTTFNVWDGWDLVQEYHMSGGNAVEDASYLYGATGLVKNLKTNNYYYQDGSGSTSHVTDSNGHLLEWYRYELQGTPIVYDGNNNLLSNGSAYGIRHLFTGQQWYSQIGLYDLRNRFYSPDIGRFLQPDPIRFRGDPTNLYRYCGNNPITGSDPEGLDYWISYRSVATGLSGQYQYNWTVSLVVSTAMDGTTSYIIESGVGSESVNYNQPAASTTAAQDLVIRDALDTHLPIDTIKYAGFLVSTALAGPHGANPVDQDTGNITNNQGDWLGWEDLNTGNVYNSEGNYAGWDSHWTWKQNFGVASGGESAEAEHVVVNATPTGWGGGFSPGDLGYTGPLNGLGFSGDYFDFSSSGWGAGGGLGPLGAGLMGQPGSPAAPSGGFLLVKYL